MHDPTICKETNGWYHHRSCARSGHWMLEFTCPSCGRTGKFQRNFLGQRKVICNGIKFTRENKMVETYNTVEVHCDEPGCLKSEKIHGGFTQVLEVLRSQGWRFKPDLCPAHARAHAPVTEEPAHA